MKPDPQVKQQKICYHLRTALGDFLAWQHDETRQQRWYCTPALLSRSADAPYPPMQWREFIGVAVIVTEYNPSIRIAVRAKGQ